MDIPLSPIYTTTTLRCSTLTDRYNADGTRIHEAFCAIGPDKRFPINVIGLPTGRFQFWRIATEADPDMFSFEFDTSLICGLIKMPGRVVSVYTSPIPTIDRISVIIPVFVTENRLVKTYGWFALKAGQDFAEVWNRIRPRYQKQVEILQNIVSCSDQIMNGGDNTAFEEFDEVDFGSLTMREVEERYRQTRKRARELDAEVERKVESRVERRVEEIKSRLEEEVNQRIEAEVKQRVEEEVATFIEFVQGAVKLGEKRVRDRLRR
jgi:hypothetical protein